MTLTPFSFNKKSLQGQGQAYFKQFQWRFNGAMYNASKVPMVNLHLKSLMKSFILYNLIISFKFILTFLTWIKNSYNSLYNRYFLQNFWTFKISLHFQFALDQIFKSLLRIDWVLNYKQLQPGTGDD